MGLVGTSTSGRWKSNDIEVNGNSYGVIARYYLEPALYFQHRRP